MPGERVIFSSRHARRRLIGEVLAVEPTNDAVGWEHRAVLHEEINRLPRTFRTAIVLCDLEGLSPGLAARQLGWPLRRLERRLAWAREHLRARMARRGIPLSGSRGIGGFLRDEESVVSRRLVEFTIATATRWRRRREIGGRQVGIAARARKVFPQKPMARVTRAVPRGERMLPGGP
jgi:hypothetical protein